MTSGSTSVTTITYPVGSVQARAQVADYTTGDVATLYQGIVVNIQNILQGNPSSPSYPTPPVLGSAEAAQLSSLLTQLQDLLLNGRSGPSNPLDLTSLQKISYVTTDMADQLQPLFASLAELGVTVNGVSPVTVSVSQAQSLQNFSATSLMLQSLFLYTNDLSSSNRSLQAMVELDFVRTGNELMADQMDKMQVALDTTKGVLDQLGNLQEAHNAITVNNRSGFVMPSVDASGNPFTSPSAFERYYLQLGSAYFNQPIVPDVSLFPTSTSTVQWVSANPVSMPATLLNPEAKTVYDNLVNDRDKIFNTSFISTTGDTAPAMYELTRGSGSTFTVRRTDSAGVTTTLGTFPIADSIHGGGGNPLTGVPLSGILPTNSSILIIPHSNYSTTLTGSVGPFTQDGFFIDDGTPSGLHLNSADWISASFPSNAPAFVSDYNALKAVAFNMGDIRNGASQISGASVTSFGVGYRQISGAAADVAAMNLQSSIFGIPSNTMFLSATMPTGTTFTPGSNIWLAFDTVSKKFKVDSRDPDDAVAYLQKLVKIRNTLSSYIPYLSGNTPRLSDGSEDTNSMLGRLRVVLNDLNTVLVTTQSGTQTTTRITDTTPIDKAILGITTWLLDNYGARNTPLGNKAGSLQQNITFAITSGQSLNDSQKESVRRFLFVFEEYYKAAGAILQLMNDLIKRMADSLAR